MPASQRDAAKARAGAKQGGSLQRFESSAPAKPAGAAPPVPAALAESSKAAGETYGGRDEAAWRALASRYRDAIERLEGQAEKCTGGEFRWAPGAGRRAYREEAAEADACGRIHSELQMNRTWLETLEERAHEAGAPPGWVRG